MTKGTELKTFITSLNGGAAIDDDLLTNLVSNGKAILEGERPWSVLRKTNSSLSATTASTWQTAYSLSGITDFSRFYGSRPVRLFDGNNLIEKYVQRPFEDRLENKDVSGTFIHDANGNRIFLNGAVPFNGSLYINYIANPTEIDLSSESAVWTEFPSRFLPILGYYAIGIYKGAVDYDSINKLMLPTNAAALQSLKSAMEEWDNQLQLSGIEENDPYEGGYPRSGAIYRD